MVHSRVALAEPVRCMGRTLNSVAAVSGVTQDRRYVGAPLSIRHPNSIADPRFTSAPAPKINSLLESYSQSSRTANGSVDRAPDC